MKRRETLPASNTPPLSSKVDNADKENASNVVFLADAFRRADRGTRKRLIRSATQLTGGDGLAEAYDAIQQDEETREKRLAWSAQEALSRLLKLRKERLKVAVDHAAQIDKFPPLHRAAIFLHIDRANPNVTVEDIKAASPLDDKWDEICDTLAAAALFLDTIKPPSSECTERGFRLVKGDEDEICKEAEKQAAAWQQIYDLAPEMDADQPHVKRQRTSWTWWRPRIRREVLDAQAYYDTALRLARAGTSNYVSGYTLNAWRQRQARSEAWAMLTDVELDNGDVISLADVRRNGERAQAAQLYATVKAMEWTGDYLGYEAFFITLTLLGHFHAVPKGKADKRGEYHPRNNPDWAREYGPKAAKDALQHLWKLLRARLWKYPELRQYFGVSIPEPHTDGTPHLHAMLWLPPRYTRRGKSRLTRALIKRTLRDIAPGLQSDMQVIKKDGPGTASAASYVMTYVIKSLNTPGEVTSEAPNGEEHLTGEGHDRYRAWASTHRIRRIRFVGVYGSQKIWQRIWTSPDDEELPERAETARQYIRAGQAHGLAAKETEDPEEKSRRRMLQAEAFARALGSIGALPHLGDGGKLKLVWSDGIEHTPTGPYDAETGEVLDTENMHRLGYRTAYGAPTKRATE